MQSDTPPPVRVLFVCLGNICRSPMAEAVFRQKVAEAGLSDRIIADSAGTSDWHVGNPPHHGTRAMLTEKGISTGGMAARQITTADLTSFDYVLTMDEANLANVRAMESPGSSAVIRPLLSYAPEAGVTEVPDPYLTGGFPEVYRLVATGCDGLLAAIRHDHTL
jgi:protein-tyrosine phosphatase